MFDIPNPDHVEIPEKIWKTSAGREIDMPPEIKAFLEDLFALYHKHGIALAHEDSQGGFMFVKNDKYHKSWVSWASLDIDD